MGLLLHEYVEHSRQNVDDWSIRRKNEQKGRDLQRYSWQQDNIEGYWLDMVKRKGCSWFIKVWEGQCLTMDFLRPDRKFDSRCYCWETNGLTLEVVVWGPRIYEIETNYKTLKVIGHCSDFEIKTLYIFKFEWNNLIEILMGNNVSYRD